MTDSFTPASETSTFAPQPSTRKPTGRDSCRVRATSSRHSGRANLGVGPPMRSRVRLASATSVSQCIGQIPVCCVGCCVREVGDVTRAHEHDHRRFVHVDE